MANIRRLKKEIDTQIYSVISDCFTFSTIHPDDKPDEISGIISDAVNFRNELIHRVNTPSTESDPKGRKVHYQMISRELDAGTDKLFERLSSVSKKRKK
jgi:hypothetical protein